MNIEQAFHGNQYISSAEAMTMYYDGLNVLIEGFFTEPSEEHLYILCPFINTNLLKDLLQKRQNVTIVTSWRKDHLLSGVSNIDLYELVKNNPTWNLMINDRLHAKIFTRGFSDMICGSANITYRALEDQTNGNFEFLTYQNVEKIDENSIKNILHHSMQMTDEIYEVYREWFSENQDGFEMPEDDSVFLPPQVDTFLISQLPASLSPSRIWALSREGVLPEDVWGESDALHHDLQLYGIDCERYDNREKFFQDLNEKFLAHPFISAFLEVLEDGEMYFGAVKAWVHHTCTDDPVPYRKEITGYVQSLFAWLVELNPTTYAVDRPNHSQRIRKI
tara:strand:- start:958 stop:1959 length:1002 start_codon:yes stop_codon:yes gene_type:complete